VRDGTVNLRSMVWAYPFVGVMGMGVGLGRLIGFFSDRNVFPRMRSCCRDVCGGGFSPRMVAEVLDVLGFRVGHELVRRWFHISSRGLSMGCQGDWEGRGIHHTGI